MNSKRPKSSHSKQAPPNEPHCPSPSLPPEIIREILGHFDLSRCNPNSNHDESLRDPDVVLDLMAVSMVCREWYNVAHSMIPYKDLRDPFRPRNDAAHSIDQPWDLRIQRFAALLVTAYKLDIPYHKPIRILPVSLSTQADFKVREAILGILRLTKPNRLQISVTEETSRITRSRVSERRRFLAAMAKHITSISHLEMVFPGPKGTRNARKPPADDPHLADLIEDMQPSLLTIQLRNNPDAKTQSALSSCTKVRSASFKCCEVRIAATILRGLSQLCDLYLSNMMGPGMEHLLMGLSSECVQLETIHIANTAQIQRIQSAEDTLRLASALQTLLARSERLKYLDLISLSYVNDDVLRTTAQSCRDLRSMIMSSYDDRTLTGAEVWTAETSPWLKLKYMCFPSHCLVPGFVEQLVKECPSLSGICLSKRFAEDPTATEMLERHGFQRRDGSMNSWKNERPKYFDGVREIHRIF
ncbi:hypothetical protein BC938DRAFT_481863 [Jimgerdemannia flammicorona]|uniref:Uncharacterized protein n=1 Tax=Jimgerdemannia flammicorona TaxID=994334 RepID=A0A433QF88_9FUNG|nr:hypothetical protein BC938DRAFT_481863 [Jimgerdemannia flammicorona]